MQGGAPSGETGLTLDEVKSAAAEAGIDPRFVDMAAATRGEHGSRKLGIPVTTGRSLALRGRLTDDRWGEMTALFSRAFGGPGRTEIISGSRLWTRGTTRISVEQAGDQVLLFAEENWDPELEFPTVLSLVGGISAGTMVALAIASLDWSIIIVAALCLLGFGVGFGAYRSRMLARQTQKQKQFDDVLDKCALVLRSDQNSAESTDAGSVSAVELPDDQFDSEHSSGSEHDTKRTRST